MLSAFMLSASAAAVYGAIMQNMAGVRQTRRSAIDGVKRECRRGGRSYTRHSSPYAYCYNGILYVERAYPDEQPGTVAQGTSSTVAHVFAAESAKTA